MSAHNSTLETTDEKDSGRLSDSDLQSVGTGHIHTHAQDNATCTPTTNVRHGSIWLRQYYRTSDKRNEHGVADERMRIQASDLAHQMVFLIMEHQAKGVDTQVIIMSL